jgi:hypothetical protein
MDKWTNGQMDKWTKTEKLITQSDNMQKLNQILLLNFFVHKVILPFEILNSK